MLIENVVNQHECRPVGDLLISSPINAPGAFGGIHEIEYGFHRSLSKRFPFGLYYTVADDCVTVVAVLDLRRQPLWIRESLDNRG